MAKPNKTSPKHREVQELVSKAFAAADIRWSDSDEAITDRAESIITQRAKLSERSAEKLNDAAGDLAWDLMDVLLKMAKEADPELTLKLVKKTAKAREKASGYGKGRVKIK